MFWVDKEDAVKRYLYRRAEDSPVEIWLNRLVVMGKITEQDWHRENGNIFNIPE